MPFASTRTAQYGDYGASVTPDHITTSWLGVVVAVVLATFAADAHPADISLQERWILIEGDVAEGDLAKFQELTSLPLIRRQDRIYLASKGGDVAEAIQIGQRVRELRLETIAPIRLPELGSKERDRNLEMARNFGIKNARENNVCASACFFIFAAGVERSGNTVGIHRPYFDPTALNGTPGGDAIDQAHVVKDVVELYLRDMGVPRRYFEIMFGTPKDKIYWLSNAEIERDFEGPIPELADWIESRCGERIDTGVYLPRPGDSREKQLADIDVKLQYEMCEMDAMTSLRTELNREKAR